MILFLGCHLAAADLRSALDELRQDEKNATDLIQRASVMPLDSSVSPEELVALLGDPLASVRQASFAIARRQARRAPQLRVALTGGLSSAGRATRMNCAEILGLIGELTESEQAALVHLLDDPDAKVQARAAWALAGRNEDPRLRAILLAALAADSATAQAIDGLGRGFPDDPEVHEAILGAMNAENATAESLITAIRALGPGIQEESAEFEAVCSLIRHDNHLVRRTAVSALGRFTSGEAGRAILTRMLTDPHADVRTAAADGLSAIEQASDLPVEALLVALSDPVPSVRSSAAAALELWCHRDDVRKALTQLRDADPDPTVRQIANRLLELP